MKTITEVLGDNKLILMTSTFDVLSEASSHTDEHGEGIDKLYGPTPSVF